MDLRNRAFLSELDTKELKDDELKRLTMFSTVDSLDRVSYANSISLYIETTSYLLSVDLNQQKMNPDIILYIEPNLIDQNTSKYT